MSASLDYSNVCVEKGFIDSIMTVFEKSDYITGIFIYSLDFVNHTKDIVTVRDVFEGELNSGINNLKIRFGNFHLNYLVHVHRDFLGFFEKCKIPDTYKQELVKFINKYNLRKYIENCNQYYYFDRNILYPEFSFLNGFFKKIKDNEIKFLFVNENLYSQFLNSFPKHKFNKK